MASEEKKVKFISYDGEYPCLCMGTLKIEVEGKPYALEQVMQSGGSVWFDDDWNDYTDYGEWSVDLSEYPELEPYKKEITDLVNEHVEQGCCGGCI